MRLRLTILSVAVALAAAACSSGAALEDYDLLGAELSIQYPGDWVSVTEGRATLFAEDQVVDVNNGVMSVLVGSGAPLAGSPGNLNPEIFAYDADKKAFIKNPTGGPYKDLVKAAERCTAQVIHPGLPKDRSAKDVAKWMQRAEKYN